MPKILEEYKKAIWKSLKGRKNPRTNKSYTESEAWAIATDTYNKKYNWGKK